MQGESGLTAVDPMSIELRGYASKPSDRCFSRLRLRGAMVRFSAAIKRRVKKCPAAWVKTDPLAANAAKGLTGQPLNFCSESKKAA